MFYEVSVGMYGAHTIVTSGVFLPKVRYLLFIMA